MEQTAKLMTIAIRESDSGMFFATSEDEPTFFVTAMNVNALYELIPLAIEDMFRDRNGIKISAFPTDRGDFGHKPWAIVPEELLVKAASKSDSAAC